MLSLKSMSWTQLGVKELNDHTRFACSSVGTAPECEIDNCRSTSHGGFSISPLQ